MTVRVGINGFGRIGRNFFRAAKQSGADIDFVAVNDLGSLDTMAHLLKYDSVLGVLPDEIAVTGDGISVDGDVLKVLADARPEAELPWGDLGVDVVIESTGFFTDRDAGRRPPRGGRPARHRLRAGNGRRRHVRRAASTTTTSIPAKHKVVSNASCTTNCFVPMVKVLDDAFGVEKGLMTTVHAYTGDQMLVDGPHKDLRRARAAAINIVPTSTGAARATGLVLESMKGKLDGTVAAGAGARRLDHRLHRPARSATSRVDEINDAFRGRGRQRPADGRARLHRRPDRVVRHRRLDPHRALRRAAHAWRSATWSRCSAGTTTSGATRTAWSTCRSSCGAAKLDAREPT